MLPTLYESFTFAADVAVLLFAIFYILQLHKREKEIQRKEKELDSSYHHIVNDALEKERQILSDASSEADKMLLDTSLSTQGAQTALQTSLQQMTTHLQKESLDTAVKFMDNYSRNLQAIMAGSLADFQTITKGLEGDMQKQVIEFRQTLLPNLEKELAAYKQVRLKQSEEVIVQIIQQVAQEVLNKALSMEDHQKLLLDSLEKAKAEGVFS